jgi:copper(I)-binding protein
MSPMSFVARSTLGAAAGVVALAVAPVTPPAAAEDTSAGAIRIESPWLRATPSGAKVAGGYMKLYNSGSEVDRLVGGASPVAGGFEVHEMRMDGNVMRMRELPDGLEIPPGHSVELKPGSYHIMLIDMAQPLQEGDRVKGTLQFAKAGKVDVVFTVRGMGSKGETGAGHGAKH